MYGLASFTANKVVNLTAIPLLVFVLIATPAQKR